MMTNAVPAFAGLWKIALFGSVIAFAALIAVLAVLRHFKRSWYRVLSYLNILLIATFFAGVIWVLPFCFGRDRPPLEAFFTSVIDVLKMFSLDADFDALRNGVPEGSAGLARAYRAVGGFLYALGPILTVGFILSLFQNISAWIRLRLNHFRRIYIFSALNEKTLALARSCQAHERSRHKRCLIVFTNVTKENMLRDEAASLRPLFTQVSPTAPMFRGHAASSERSFFALDENEDENLQLALDLIDLYWQDQNTGVYCFATSQESALILSNAAGGTKDGKQTKLKIRRVNQVQSLIYHYMFDLTPEELSAFLMDRPDGKKELSVALIGFGQYGTEFLKTFIWGWQLPNCRVCIHVFDADPKAKQRFTFQCPELMEKNHRVIEGDARYDIWFHLGKKKNGVDVHSTEFYTLLRDRYSLVVVALGGDAENLETAVNLRQFFTRTCPDNSPRIEAVVYRSSKARSLRENSFLNHSGQDYDIHVIGDLDTTYSYDTVVDDELELWAKRQHLEWSRTESAEVREREERKFYQFEYHYRSSVATVIRWWVRFIARIPGMDLPGSERTREQDRLLKELEHIGWNAYMRCEGFVFAEQKNYLALQHGNLVPTTQLTEKDREKDADDWSIGLSSRRPKASAGGSAS